MKYGLDMPLRGFEEDAEAAAIFDRFLPGMRTRVAGNREAGGMTLRMLARYAGGAIPRQALDALDAALKALGEKNGDISPAERARMVQYQKMAAADAARTAEPEQFPNTAVHPGQVWLDTRGRRIEAHAGGMLYENGTYYWYGENKEHTDGVCEVWTWGIRLYSSKDFYNWTDEGLIILPNLDDPNSDLFPEKRVDRPHIVKNERTGQYVCWLKLCGDGANFVVLTADTLKGPYTVVQQKYKPFGLNIGDFDLAVDPETHTAYLYCEAEHDRVVGFRLNESYTEAVEQVSVQYEGLYAPFCREGITVFARQGKLYMLTSGMTGYVPNQSDTAVSDGYEQPFASIGDPHVDDPSMASFNSQIGQVFRVPGKKELYIAIADRWVPDYVVDAHRADVLRRAIANSHDPEHYPATDEEKRELMQSPMLASANTHLANYVLLPITFAGDKPQICWRDSWTLEEFE